MQNRKYVVDKLNFITTNCARESHYHLWKNIKINMLMLNKNNNHGKISNILL